jgi:glycosyltransferase involved in cell wall biosynthesis
MRALVVAGTLPWPEVGGSRRRLATVLRGLARVGDVDLVLLVDQATADPPWSSAAAPVRRVLALPRPPGRFRGWRRLWWLVAGRVPAGLVGRDYGGVRDRVRRWCTPPYDLVWYGRVESYVALHDVVQAPAVVDFDDLEDWVIRRRLECQERPWQRGDPTQWVRRYAGRRDARLWAAAQESVARAVAVVTVCSEVDRRRVGVDNCQVLPNAYPAPASPVGRDTVGTPPTVLFHGTLTHPPNADAARFLVEVVAPRLWARMPGLQIRLAGHCDHRLARMHAPPRVIVTGFVEDMTVELARADVVAVPVRFASGTRVKILEAFAHGVPVVSTVVGAEGLDIRDGHEALLADEPGAFADACCRVLTDLPLRRRLVTNARATFLQRFQADHVEAMVARLALAVAAGRSASVA